MRITRVECIPVHTPLKRPIIIATTHINRLEQVILKIHTDDGLVGIADSGDTSAFYHGETHHSIAGIIACQIAPRILIGEDPFNIEKIVGRMDLIVRDNYHAKSMVDAALHDIKGKALGVPVYQLLGGKTVDAIDCGYVLMAAPAQQLIDEARKALAKGFKVIKVKPSMDFDQSVQSMINMRAELGPEARLMIDVNGMWTYDMAYKALRTWDRADVNLELIEQPLPYWDIEGMARLREKVGTPIWADESARELQNIKEIIDRRAADGLFIKVQKAGGLLKAQRWLTLARLSGLPVMCGCMPGSSLEAAPTAHLLVANQWASQYVQENCGPLSIHDAYELDDTPRLGEVAFNGPNYIDGRMYAPERPGLGADLNEDFIKEFTSTELETRIIT
ncbi:L-alanine-DL-glutamate epimerase-like enolase superfamily enzyme [Novosphingobium sp. SG751A]|uniref:mandelate racemase/muconate lactonizing enzyme family protein n=1 Tax=Novosphingobium sp. SG751A TaxID=2587000 RepID=UPI00155697D2|nr:mandelate racemase/muconate lactonizing enzyme family protein [Novosphingobium sp. SG751A]NOW47971.1 L-alanine-DL-glutamate epimerase-like enolase superfamily enzyme [Novosphingobium sp. SG751A]